MSTKSCVHEGVPFGVSILRLSTVSTQSQDVEKGVEFKGGSLHDGFGGFAGSGEHLALLLLVLQSTAPRGNHDGFGGFGGCGGFGHDGFPPPPPKLNPPLSSS